MLNKYSNIYNIYNVLEKINKYSEIMDQQKDNVSTMIEVYKYLKENLLLFYNDGRINYYYGRVIALIMTCEAKLPKSFIIESNPIPTGKIVVIGSKIDSDKIKPFPLRSSVT